MKKFYQCVKSSPRDQHIRRVIWGKDERREPKTLLHTTLAFGDTCAGAVAQIALELMAERFGQGREEAKVALTKCIYVDDIAGGGVSVEEVGRINTDIDYVLDKGGFSAKPIHYTGQAGSTAVLGME